MRSHLRVVDGGDHDSDPLGGTTTDGVLDVVGEVALQDTDPPPGHIGDCLGGQVVLGRPVHQFVSLEARSYFPSVDFGFAFEPEEEGGSQVGTQDDGLASLDSEILDLAGGTSSSQMFSLDLEDSASGQVGEYQVVAALGFADECDVEDVASAVGDHLREDYSVTSVSGDVEDQDGAGSGIADVDEGSAIGSVFSDNVLQSGGLGYQTAQVQGFDFLSGQDVDGDDLGCASTDGVLQSVDNTDVEYPQYVVFVQVDVDNVLEGVEVTFFLGGPAWVGLEDSFASLLFQVDAG